MVIPGYAEINLRIPQKVTDFKFDVPLTAILIMAFIWQGRGVTFEGDKN